MIFARSLFGQTEYFVSVDGNDGNDGLSWAEALATVRAAVEKTVDGDTVLISNGTYMVTCGGIAVTNDITIRGVNGPEVTILDAGYISPRRIFVVNSPGARIEGITATRARWAVSGGAGAIIITNGIVSNCIISASLSYHNGGGVFVNGGTLTDSIIHGNDSGSTGPGGVHITNGVVQNCVISNNITGWNSTMGGGIYVTGGMVSNTLIVANTSGVAGSPDVRGGGVYQIGGLIVNCEIKDNLGHRFGGGIYQNGGILRNTLIAGNYASKGGGGIYLMAGAVENCTVVGNHTAIGGGDGIWMSGGTVSNTISYFNAGDNLS